MNLRGMKLIFKKDDTCQIRLPVQSACRPGLGEREQDMVVRDSRRAHWQSKKAFVQCFYFQDYFLAFAG